MQLAAKRPGALLRTKEPGKEGADKDSMEQEGFPTNDTGAQASRTPSSG